MVMSHHSTRRGSGNLPPSTGYLSSTEERSGAPGEAIAPQDRAAAPLDALDTVGAGELSEPLRATLDLYERAIAASSCGIVIASMQHRDRPLIYCNRAFEAMTGYGRDEVLGRNCRFLQGPETDPQEIERIRRAVKAEQPCEVVLLNYRKDGTPFWNNLAISPVHDAQGTLTHYIGIQTDITQQRRADKQNEQQLRGEQFLSGVVERIRQSLDLDAVLETAVAEVRSLLTTDRVLVYRFNDDWSGTVVAESIAAGWTPSLNARIEDTCLQTTRGSNYVRGKAQVIDDIDAIGLDPCHHQLLSQFEVRANLVVPILQGDSLWGLLICHQCRSTRRWSYGEVCWIQRLADQLAIAVQQAELYEQAQAEIAHRRAIEAQLQASKTQIEAQARCLQEALQDLQWHQSRLVQSEKLSGLGKLVAGIAHEINNPVSFIYGNLRYVRSYANDLLNLLDGPPNAPGGEDLDNGSNDSDDLDDVDLDFIRQDLPKILTSMESGAERIRNIVTSLRTFARLDEAAVKEIDLHASLDSTLMVLQARWNEAGIGSAIELVRDYGALPPLVCCPGQLNQVFVSLIDNAFEALQTALGDATWASRHDRGRITIQTALDATGTEPLAIIRITDNGLGISPALRPKIFDPFFTTKAVGQGTGLGLSMSYQIVTEQHGGRLTYEPAIPSGAVFTVAVPLKGCADHQGS
jgi:two-component system NtrC family sensor kinase